MITLEVEAEFGRLGVLAPVWRKNSFTSATGKFFVRDRVYFAG